MDVVDVLLQTLTGVPNPLVLRRNLWLLGWEPLWVAEMSFLARSLENRMGGGTMDDNRRRGIAVVKLHEHDYSRVKKNCNFVLQKGQQKLILKK